MTLRLRWRRHGFGPDAPEPRSIAAKCNKEVGGHYDWLKKQWVVHSSLIMAKNACVQRMMEKGR